jgi:hypothetical protein
MPQWEYKVIPMRAEAPLEPQDLELFRIELDGLGLDQWEAFQILADAPTGWWVFFKRPLEE